MLFDQLHSFDSLFRSQDPAGNARTAFVDTVEFTLTKTAFDIASGSHGKMHPSGLVVIAAETRVIALLLEFHHRAGTCHVHSPVVAFCEGSSTFAYG